MINLHTGKQTAVIRGGKHDSKIVHIDTDYNDGVDEIVGKDCKLIPMINKEEERNIFYIAGPSGSGKSSYAASIISTFIKIYTKSTIYVISRTNYKNDPALKHLKMVQIEANELMLENKIDIEKDIRPNSLMLFDDFNTISNKEVREYVEHLICDILECGRKLRINIIMTNHLLIPNEKKFARILLNEIQNIIVFPKSGSSQQIRYVLKTYFGLSTKEINEVLKLKSRWVCIKKTYPMTVLYETGIYII